MLKRAEEQRITYNLVELLVLLIGILGEVFIEVVLGDGVDDVVLVVVLVLRHGGIINSNYIS